MEIVEWKYKFEKEQGIFIINYSKPVINLDIQADKEEERD